MARHTHEPTVRFSAPMPEGYIFLPKGNVYMTSHCRKQTLAANETVFRVLADGEKGKAAGIRVPARVHEAVRASHDATRHERARAVHKKDARLESAFVDAALGLFPRAPAAELRGVAVRATWKRSGRVGRSGALDLERRVSLAVRAHVRHRRTDYDRLMRRSGFSRERARAETWPKVEEVMRLWRGDIQHKDDERGKPKKKCPGPGSITRGSGTKEKPVKGTVSGLPRKTVTKPAGATPMEKKHNTRRTRAAVATRGKIPETEGMATRRSPRRAAGESLRDDANSESEEFEWSSSEEDSDEEWTEH
ncbi:hypothetical protein DL764_003911 [Monosporascus ibericus]|uniref:DUF2293 domain-containing protein n=1 Tax=Monosporascus ibericus TaxID=155417 RepID=A0A4Q4TJ84_9PEZI|nr:hypothetical protein DL764_003911 [Monosporascus ibericus]